ncbi:MAG TPA: bifunctional oligoribonuclease/PAP phosphatase NrnA [Bacteroidota bacterium]|nr:bifunctional oligoribonuclease/PAP phosphatase NrnA [Bacteroidota bacterium]
MKEYDQFQAILAKSTNIVLSTHINPDADGIGSELALCLFLEGKGKRVSILNHSETPDNLLFLDPDRRVIRFDPANHAGIIRKADLIVILDTNHPDRLASLKPYVLESKAPKVCIDHHLEPASFADLYILDEPSTATGEIVYKLLAYSDKAAMTPHVATLLYAAIMTDTGSFRYPKTDAEMHRIIAHLIESGADPVVIYQSLYEQGTPGRVRLLGQTLATLQMAHGDKAAYFTITRKMFQDTGTTEADADAFVPYTLTIKGVQIGLMFTELPGDVVKVSFRARGDIWVNKLAQEFGGNGHQHAAGARVHNAHISDVIGNVVESAGKYIR